MQNNFFISFSHYPFNSQTNHTLTHFQFYEHHHSRLDSVNLRSVVRKRADFALLNKM